MLEKVRAEFNVPVITDVHEDTPIDEVASVVDVMQTPAFLCRQTNFIQRVAAAGKPVNIKKGQFMAPEDMQNVVSKALATDNKNIMLCERGVSLAIAHWSPICADLQSCGRRVVPWCSMQLTRCSSLEDLAVLPVASASLYRF